MNKILGERQILEKIKKHFLKQIQVLRALPAWAHLLPTVVASS